MIPVRVARVPLIRLDVSRPRFRSTVASAPHQTEKHQPTCPKPEAHSQERPKEGEAAKKKTVAQQDEDLRARLEASSGDGGSAGVEYENGVAQGLKSQVKNNMFRVI